MSASTMADVLDRLVVNMTAAFADQAAVQIVDGDADNQRTEYVAVGCSWDDDRAPVEFRRKPADAAMRRDAEELEISCVLSTWVGDTTLSAARARAVAMLTVVDQAVAADRRLNGLAQMCRVSEGSLEQAIDGEGSVATIPFVIHVTAIK